MFHNQAVKMWTQVMVSEMSGCLDFSQDTKTRTWGELIASHPALKLWPERNRTGGQFCQEPIPTLTSALKADLNSLAAMSLSFTKFSVSFLFTASIFSDCTTHWKISSLWIIPSGWSGTSFHLPYTHDGVTKSQIWLMNWTTPPFLGFK